MAITITVAVTAASARIAGTESSAGGSGRGSNAIPSALMPGTEKYQITSSVNGGSLGGVVGTVRTARAVQQTPELAAAMTDAEQEQDKARKERESVLVGVILGLVVVYCTILLTRRLRHKAMVTQDEEEMAEATPPAVMQRPRWPIVVGAFYLLAVIANTPTILFGLGDVRHGEWGRLAIACMPMVIVMLGGALLLLSVRVPTGPRRLPPLRHIAKPVAATIILLLVLSCGLMLSLATAIKGDDWNAILCLCLMGGFWLLWAVVFFLYARKKDNDMVVAGAVRILLAGSVLELLVSVTSHIMLRHRNVCCAPMFNFWGMTMGLSIMFIAFGPGIVFLYLRRLNRKKTREV